MVPGVFVSLKAYTQFETDDPEVFCLTISDETRILYMAKQNP